MLVPHCESRQHWLCYHTYHSIGSEDSVRTTAILSAWGFANNSDVGRKGAGNFAVRQVILVAHLACFGSISESHDPAVFPQRQALIDIHDLWKNI
jgi:hypothetical protein